MVAPVAPARVWSREQEAIFEWFSSSRIITGGTSTDADRSLQWGLTQSVKHLTIDAVAGSGKTTTLIEGVSRAPESNPLVCAFNKRIADELTSRLAHTVATAKTLHGLGYGLIRRQWKGMPVAKDSERADQLTAVVINQAADRTKHLTGTDRIATAANTPKPILRLVSKLHTKAREMSPINWTEDTLTALALQFQCEPDGGWKQYPLEYVVHRAAEALVYAATVEPSRAVGIDFADMLYLPLVWNLTSRDYDLVVVDEAQDMTLAQLELAERVSCGRIVICGDRNQAIYSFRGADSGSRDRLREKLGAAELPLTTTYRCATSIVARAQRLVPHIQAVAGAPEGTVSTVEYTEMLREAAGGDFILSRLNAPLVSATLALLRAGKRARMAGRDIGTGITALVKRLKATSINDFGVRLDQWERQTVQKYAERGLLDLVDQAHDQADMLRAFAEDTESLSVMLDKIYWLFTDVPEDDQIVLSSVHKAKGLERERVWFLQESLYRRGDSEEERNIDYVGITRARHALCIVTGVPSLQRQR